MGSIEMHARKILFVLSFFVVACTPDAPPSGLGTTASASPMATVAATVQCDASVGGEQVPPAGFEIVGDAVALPTSQARSQALQVAKAELPDGKPGFFAKQGLLVRRDRLVELIVPEDLRDLLWIEWGTLKPPGDHVVVDHCDGDDEWLAFTGGYTIRRAACLPVEVRVGNGATQRVRIGVGAPCPGQQPAPRP